MSFPVKVYIYDISKGMARSMSGPLLGRQLDGIWHTAVVVYGQEIFYGGNGIDRCEPGGTILGQPDRVEEMGSTEIPYDVFMAYLMDLASSSYKGECYHLFDHNCNNFSDEVSQFLTGRSVPSYITSLPQEVLNTPMGAMLRPFLDAMSVNPSGGTPIQNFYQPEITPAATSSPQQSSGQPQQNAQPTENNCSPAVKPASFDISTEVAAEVSEVREELGTQLGAERSVILGEIVEYVRETTADWGVGRPHIKLIADVLKDEAYTDAQKQLVAGLLQQLLLREDVIVMLSHDSTAAYRCLLQNWDQQSPGVQERLVRGLCNCYTHQTVPQWLRGSEDEKVSLLQTSSLVGRQSLLDEDASLQSAGAALAHNVTAHSVTPEMAVDLGCALVELLQKEIDEKTAEHTIIALSHCIKSNEEVAAFAAVSGLTISEVVRHHPELKDLSESLLAADLAKYAS